MTAPEENTSRHCKGFTSDGQPCQHVPTKGEEYCWQHKPKPAGPAAGARKPALPGSDNSRFVVYTTVIASIVTVFAFVYQVYADRSIAQARTLHFLFIVDSSARMASGPAGGESKWNTLRQSIEDHMVHGLPEGAGYELVVLGGRPFESTGSCSDIPSNKIVPMGRNNSRKVLAGLDGLEPRGVASLADALDQAREDLFDLPDGHYKALYLFLGGGDECDKDPWHSLKYFLKDSAELVDARIEIVILPGESVDETVRAASEIKELVGDLELENIEVYTPKDSQELAQAVAGIQDQALQDTQSFAPAAVAEQRTELADASATAQEETGEAPPTPASPASDTPPASFTPAPPQATATAVPPRATEPPNTTAPSKTPTPVPTLTRTPLPAVPSSSTPSLTATNTSTPTRTDSPTDTPSPTLTATVTLTPTPTKTPTIPPHTQQPLPSQSDVFSAGCPLAGNARQYIQFYQGQARLASDLVTDSQRAGNVLRLGYSNISAEGGNYAGWEVWLGPGDDAGIDLSSYASLAFYIKGDLGGELVNVYLMMPTIDNNYQRYWKDVETVAPLTTSWRKIVIPLSDFTLGQAPHEQVDLHNIQRIQMVFEWYPALTSGRIYIDDLCVE